MSHNLQCVASELGATLTRQIKARELNLVGYEDADD